MKLPQVSEDTVRLVTLDAAASEKRVEEFTKEQSALFDYTGWVMMTYGPDAASMTLSGMVIAYTALKLELSKQQ